MDKRRKMLADEKVSKLLLKLSVPAMIGMMVQALYNFVDAVFIGRGVGPQGIAAVSIGFPVQMIVMAVAQMIGIGGASIISRKLGEGDFSTAEKTTGNVFSLTIIISVLISIFGLIFLNPLLILFGSTDTLLNYAADYLQTILFGTIVFALSMALNNVIRAEGNAKVAMLTMLISASLNIVLDPIFIFVFNMGIRGAALATVISQASTLVYILYYFINGKSMLKVRLKNLILNFKIIAEIFAIGSSAFMRQVAGSIFTIVVNNVLKNYGGDNSIATFGMVNRIIMFAFMPLFGVAQGFQPIAGFSYGSKRFDRTKESIKYGLIYSTVLSVIGFFVVIIFAEPLAKMFTTDAELISQTVMVLRIVLIMLPLIGFQVIGASLFQSIGKAVPALILSMSRQIIFLIPMVIILPNFFNLMGVWVSFPVSDFLSVILTAYFFFREMRTLNKHIDSLQIQDI